MSFTRTPLVPLAAAFATGIAGASLLGPATLWVVWLAAVAGGASLAWLGRTIWAAAALLVGVAALGALGAGDAPLPSDHVGRLALPRVARVEGRLAAEPRYWAPDRVRLWLDALRADETPASGRIQVAVYGVPPTLTVGQRIAAPLRLHPARGFRNPGTFDYGEYLTREGIRVVATVRAEAITPLDAPGPPWPVRVKRESIAAIERALPPVSAALLGGLLLGDRAGLPPDVDEAFRRAGVYHVLAVSGFNVAVLAAAVWALCGFARVGRRVAAVVAIVVVIGFALVVGPQPSVLRAVIMAVLVLAAVLLERDPSVTNSLALAALAILALRPGDLFDPGFQLSFAATAGIVLAPLPSIAGRAAGRRGVLLVALGASVAAQLAVLPVTLTHFNQLSTVGVVANLGVVPLAAAATVMGLAAVGLSFVSETIAAVAFDAVWPLLLALRGVVTLAAAVPWAVVHLPAPGPLAVASYVGGLAMVVARRTGAAVILLAIAVAAAAWPLVRPADGRLRLTVLDVGQGDAIVAEMPDGRAILVDAGPGGPRRLDAGEHVVAPFLWNRGVLSLAGAFVTHDDSDHAGGLGAVRRRFRIDEHWTAREPPTTPRWFGGVMVTALPRLATGGRRNDDSLVLRLEVGLVSFLLASDIEAARERELATTGLPIAATVLKVAHHGSRSSTSAEFVRAVRPVVAVISVGARNAYGHPDPGVIARLAQAGARIYRTDRDGAVILETDGHTLHVTRWASRRVERICLDPEAIC